MRKHRINLFFHPRKARGLPRKNPFGIIRGLLIRLIVIIAIFIAAVFIFIRAGGVIRNLDYFKIKEIAVSQGQLDELSNLLGRNIFEVNLPKEAGYMSELYPNYKKIRLIRVLPNRIFVDFIKRKPIAYVKLYRYFCVDRDHTLFDVTGELSGMDLPEILGLETKIFGPKAGKSYNIKELTLALEIIKELNNNRLPRNIRLKTVDVANPANAAFFLQVPGQLLLEFKIGQYDIKNKLNILNTLLTNIKNDLTNIKYIDLRFKEPVIRFKDAK